MKLEQRGNEWFIVDTDGTVIDGPYASREDAIATADAFGLKLEGVSDSTVQSGPWAGATKSVLNDAFTSGEIDEATYRELLPQVGVTGEASLNFAVTQNRPESGRTTTPFSSLASGLANLTSSVTGSIKAAGLTEAEMKKLVTLGELSAFDALQWYVAEGGKTPEQARLTMISEEMVRPGVTLAQIQQAAGTPQGSTQPAAGSSFAPSAASGMAGASAVSTAAPTSTYTGPNADYYATAGPDAIRIGQQYGLDPAYLLGMGASETNWGAASGFNYGGIMGTGTAGSKQFVSQGSDAPGSTGTFAQYNTPAEGFQAFIDLISGATGMTIYKPAWDKFQQTKDTDQLFRDIQQAGYTPATDWPDIVGSLAQQASTALSQGAGGGQAASAGPSWASAPVTQGYGPTSETLDSGYNGYANFNKGIDYAVGPGTPIDANVSGTVIAAGDQGDGWGISVKVQDANGYVHNYGHLSAANVTVGQQIDVGTILGASGNTGASTGPHLSYDVMDPSGQFIEPSRFVSGGAAGGGLASILPLPEGPDVTEAQIRDYVASGGDLAAAEQLFRERFGEKYSILPGGIDQEIAKLRDLIPQQEAPYTEAQIKQLVAAGLMDPQEAQQALGQIYTDPRLLQLALAGITPQQPQVPINLQRAEQMRAEGPRGTPLYRTAAAQGGIKDRVNAFRALYPEFGPDYVPSDAELVASGLGGSLPVPDRTRAANLASYDATGALTFSSLKGAGPTQRQTVATQAQGLEDLIGNGTFTDEGFRRTPVLNPSERTLFETGGGQQQVTFDPSQPGAAFATRFGGEPAGEGTRVQLRDSEEFLRAQNAANAGYTGTDEAIADYARNFSIVDGQRGGLQIAGLDGEPSGNYQTVQEAERALRWRATNAFQAGQRDRERDPLNLVPDSFWNNSGANVGPSATTRGVTRNAPVDQANPTGSGVSRPRPTTPPVIEPPPPVNPPVINPPNYGGGPVVYQPNPQQTSGVSLQPQPLSTNSTPTLVLEPKRKRRALQEARV